MKRIFLTFLCVISFLISLFVPVFASQLVYAQYHFPDPSLDGNFVLANESVCRVFYPIFIPGGYDISLTESGNTYSGTMVSDDKKVFCIASLSQDGQYFVLTFYNFFDVDIDILYVSYNQAGTVQATNLKTIPANGNTTFNFGISGYTSGFYSKNIILDQIFASYPLANISFSNSVDYTSQFYTVQTSLESIIGKCNSLISQNTAYYNLIHAWLSDVFYTDPLTGDVNSNVEYHWDEMCEKIFHIAQTTMTFASEFSYWYQYQYIPKTDYTNNLLAAIYSYLTTSDVSQPDMENQTEMESAIDSYEEAEQSLMNQQNQVVGRLDNVIGGWDSDLGGSQMTAAFGFIKQFFETYLFQYYSLFFIIPLTFGVIVLILGRRLQR